MTDAPNDGDQLDEIVLGVAVAIPEPHATVLTKWRARVGDPAAELVFPHVTLLPPTPVPVAAMDDVEKHLGAAATALEPFSMHLAGTGTFRPLSPVVFIQIATGVSQCEVLEQAIRTGPLDRDLEFPYHPHVTVAHDIDDAALDEAYDGLAGFVARFPVTEIVLFSRDIANGSGGGRWRWRTEFPLGGTNPDGAG